MKPETAQRMNELARMTPEARRADLVREIFGGSPADFTDGLIACLEKQREILADMEATLERMAERRAAFDAQFPNSLPSDIPTPQPIGEES